MNANSSVQRDFNGNTQTSGVNTKLPLYPSPLPERAFSEQGSVAFDKTLRQFAYFDGLAWVYLGGGVTGVVNVGGGAEVFKDFNPNLQGNKVARLRTIVGDGGIVVSQQADTITISNPLAITNIGGGAEIFETFANPNKTSQLRTIVSGSENITVKQLPSTIEISIKQLGNTFNSCLNTNYATTGSNDGWETINLWTTATNTAHGSGNNFPIAPGWGVAGIDGNITAVSFATPGVYSVIAVLDFDDSLIGAKQVFARIRATRGINNWAPAYGKAVPLSIDQVNSITLSALINQPVGAPSTQVQVELYVTAGNDGDTQPVVQAAAPINDTLTNPGSFFSVTLVQFS